MFNIFKKKQKNKKIQATMESIVANLAAINNKNQSMIMNSKQSNGFRNNNFYDVENMDSPRDIQHSDYEPSKDEVIIEVESKPKIPKTNFVDVLKNLTKNKLIFIPVLMGLVLILALYNTKMPFIELEPLKLSNQDIVLKSKNHQFFAKINKSFQSQPIQGVNTVNLGKIEGDNKIVVGGILDLGIIKLNGLNTKEFNVKRDYSPIDYKTDIAKYYDTLKPTVKFKFVNEEKDFRLFINNELVYGGDQKETNCELVIDSLGCKVDFGPDKKKNLEFKIIDKAGNINISDIQTIEYIDAIDFNCDKKYIENEGKIKCISNTDGILKFKEVDYVLNKDKEFVIPMVLDDGKTNIELSFVSSLSFKKDIVIEADINKQNNILEFKTNIIENLNGTKGQIITLNAVAGNDATLDLSQSYYLNPLNGNRFPLKKNLNFEVFKKESTTIFSDLYANNTDKLNTIIKVKMSNKAGINSYYQCTKEFNQLEFNCTKL
jgi:CxxC motif-containing protein